MRALTAERWSTSAYRTLGLSATASQVQIDQAARRMRIWPDSKSIPPTPWDLPWLGQICRNKHDIEQAVARLSDPATRIEERLLWYHATNPATWSAKDIPALAHTLGALAKATGPATVHDYALVRLQLALIEDENFTNTDRWQKVLTRLDSLCESDSFLAWMLDVEQKSDFEKRAQIEEIGQIVAALPQTLASAIAARAESALEADDLLTARRILTLLRLAAPSVAGECEEQILDRLEDLLERHCGDIHDQLHRIGAPDINQRQIQTMCGKAATIYNQRIDPLLSEIPEVAGSDSDLYLRARTSAARVMGHMGQCWAMARKMKIAQNTLEAALAIGEGTPMENAIQDNLERCRQAQRWVKTPPRTAVARMHPNQLFVPTYARQVASKRGLFSSSGGRSKLSPGAYVAIVIAVAAGRALLTVNSSSHSSPSEYQTPAPYRWQSPYRPPYQMPEMPQAPQMPQLPPAYRPQVPGIPDFRNWPPPTSPREH
jgi:hypothetical protein